MPEWFPFALAATAVIALFAGARSGWRLEQPAPVKPPPNPPPPPQGVHGWL